MGKLPYLTTDSEETEDTSSSVENMKKKKFSILKCTNGNVKKKKCKIHSKSEPEDSDYRSRSRSNHKVRYKLPGILKYADKDRESSEDEEDSEPVFVRTKLRDRCLVGSVPCPAGAKPGRGGGVAIIVKKNVLQALQAQDSTSSTKRKRSLMKRLVHKRSY